MTSIKLILATIFYLSFSVVSLKAQVETPGNVQTKSILILNGTAHLGNGKVVKNAAIAFKGGKLTMVENAS